MADFNLKRHDLLPPLKVICTDSGGNPVDLTGASSVVFNMKGQTGMKITRAAAVIIDASGGLVQYNWAGTDTDTSGTYSAEFEVDFPGSKPETFPNTTNIQVSIVDDLA